MIIFYKGVIVLYKILYENIADGKYRGEIKYSIEFPECVAKDSEFCQEFLDSLDEQIKSLIIKMGLKFK